MNGGENRRDRDRPSKLPAAFPWLGMFRCSRSCLAGRHIKLIRVLDAAEQVQPQGVFCSMVLRYRADVKAEEAWKTLTTVAGATLVDVRTSAEWSYVGLPDLSGTDAALFRLEWQRFPDGALNPSFVEDLHSALQASGKGPDSPIFFICRSGARSASAAAAMTEAGYANCINIADGFEGGSDERGHRGTLEGWKAASLPWVQS